MLLIIVATLLRWLREVLTVPPAPIAANPGVGADAQYAVELHTMGAMEQVRTALAVELGLDPLDPIESAILEDAIALRLSVTERLEHFRARWEREVEPLVRHLGPRFVGPLAPSGAVTASTFDGIRSQAHILALPAVAL